MYHVGECIVYGAQGACIVNNIGESTFSKEQDGALYYTLVPFGENEVSITTPVDSKKVHSRSVMNLEEMETLLLSVDNLESIKVRDARKKDEEYREILKSADAGKVLRLIKTLYEHKVTREHIGKKITSSDESFLKKSVKILCSEMAYLRHEDVKSAHRKLVELLEHKVQA
ncbi:CarD family transcriptional regulator [Eubacterium oxidoreducens]|uniref:Transcriptional regulator, CarD family n=1 Tax=Eubacterium oxidoreducens TaxID=1732 RepID=A0A1G6C1P6_EUBOX|nr:CarD family transcriptional regulator [Eubacterium oxidoreducens]SDB26776.1 transcriptional regulator, CarD family [Eubacterium oxidoreducens]